MKIWIFLFLVISGLIVIGCGNQTVRSIEIYIQQNDFEAARRTANKDLPTMPDGKAKAEVYMLLAKMTNQDIEKLNAESKRDTLGKKQNELFERRMTLIQQFNHEVNQSLQNNLAYKGFLDTLKTNLWINLYNEGVEPYKNNKWDVAILHFTLAWTLDSSKTETGKLIGDAYISMKKGKEGENWLKRTIAMEDKTKPDYSTRLNLGNYYFYEEKWEQAVQVYSEILSLPEPPKSDSIKYKNYLKIKNQSLSNKAIALDQLNRSTEATKAYEEALKDQPDNDILWYNFGKRHFESERYKDAEQAIQNVLRINPNDVDAMFLMGLIKFQLEKYDEAERYLSQVVKIKPEMKTAWVNLAGAIGNQIYTLTQEKNPDKVKLEALQKRFKEVNEEMKKRGIE
ncbi:MAG: tetratricopeptide repeat protein [bacterium]|nr:tetratricopeptide repeat protein [bacterium]